MAYVWPLDFTHRWSIIRLIIGRVCGVTTENGKNVRRKNLESHWNLSLQSLNWPTLTLQYFNHIIFATSQKANSFNRRKKQRQVTQRWQCNNNKKVQRILNMGGHLLARQAMQNKQKKSKKIDCKVFGILTAACAYVTGLICHPLYNV